MHMCFAWRGITSFLTYHMCHFSRDRCHSFFKVSGHSLRPNPKWGNAQSVNSSSKIAHMSHTNVTSQWHAKYHSTNSWIISPTYTTVRNCNVRIMSRDWYILSVFFRWLIEA